MRRMARVGSEEEDRGQLPVEAGLRCTRVAENGDVLPEGVVDSQVEPMGAWRDAAIKLYYGKFLFLFFELRSDILNRASLASPCKESSIWYKTRRYLSAQVVQLLGCILYGLRMERYRDQW